MSEPFERGYAAERQGLGFLDNPYPQDSTEARVWVDGYVKSMQDSRANQPGEANG
jgi:hypothetical protein